MRHSISPARPSLLGHLTSLGRYARLAVLAGSLTAACHVQAANDFDALLAEVAFGQEPAAGEPLELEPAAEVNSPSDTALSLPPEPAEALPEPSAAGTPATPPAFEVVEETPATAATPIPATVVESCDSCQSGHCGSHHGQHHEAFCQPYVPPRLPTSTFYQYWRSNSCNTQVWNGYRNRCHQFIDLTVKPKSHHGCLGGKCDTACAAAGEDCGPLPEEWMAAGTGGSCD